MNGPLIDEVRRRAEVILGRVGPPAAGLGVLDVGWPPDLPPVPADGDATWGEPLPPCPGHPHPLSAHVVDGVAVWECPRDADHHREPILP